MKGVYLIGHAGYGWYKIGMSAKNVLERVKGLAASLPFVVTTYYIWHTEDKHLERHLESHLHEKFGARRVSQEWFKLRLGEIHDVDAEAQKFSEGKYPHEGAGLHPFI
jgi:hypothetical protein